MMHLIDTECLYDENIFIKLQDESDYKWDRNYQ